MPGLLRGPANAPNNRAPTRRWLSGAVLGSCGMLVSTTQKNQSQARALLWVTYDSRLIGAQIDSLRCGVSVQVSADRRLLDEGPCLHQKLPNRPPRSAGHMIRGRDQPTREDPASINPMSAPSD